MRPQVRKCVALTWQMYIFFNNNSVFFVLFFQSPVSSCWTLCGPPLLTCPENNYRFGCLLAVHVHPWRQLSYIIPDNGAFMVSTNRGFCKWMLWNRSGPFASQQVTHLWAGADRSCVSRRRLSARWLCLRRGKCSPSRGTRGSGGRCVTTRNLESGQRARPLEDAHKSFFKWFTRV